MPGAGELTERKAAERVKCTNFVHFSSAVYVKTTHKTKK